MIEPPTLASLFDDAAQALRDAAAMPVPSGPVEHAGRVRDLALVIEMLRRSPGTTPGAPPSTMALRTIGTDMTGFLYHAAESMRIAQTYLPGAGPMGSDPTGRLYERALQRASAVTDLMASHRSPSGSPLTPYAHVMASARARDYLVQRTAELAAEASVCAQVLTRNAPHPEAGQLLEMVRASLRRAASDGASGPRNPLAALGALPYAPPLTALSATERADPAATRLLAACDRTVRLAHTALHGGTAGGRRLSGSDLREIAVLRMMTDFASGRALHELAKHQPGAEWSDEVRAAARHLRTAALAWQKSGEPWERLVDISDPRYHPRLAQPGYDLKRSGRLVPIPRTTGHPAVAVVESAAYGIGELLYGPTWKPFGRLPPLRPMESVLAETGGAPNLIGLLYRVPETGWALAVGSEASVRHARPDLVTDGLDLRPSSLSDKLRFYPAHHRQLSQLSEGLMAAAGAERSASRALIAATGIAGVPQGRVELDAAARRFVVEPVPGRYEGDGADTTAAERFARAMNRPPLPVSTTAARARSTSPSQGPLPAPSRAATEPVRRNADAPRRGPSRGA